MADAYVRYRQGGGYQAVLGYDYVLDTRKLVESGFYRDSGFSPMALPAETGAIGADEFNALAFGTGSSYQLINGTIATATTPAATIPDLSIQQPDEVTHEPPRQLSYYETTLSFFANSDVSATFTANTASGNLRLTVADSSLFAGRPVLLSGADLPAGSYPYQIYYPVALTSTTMLLQTSLGGAYVPWTDDGSGTLTVTALDILGQFQWANILGWSNTAPTR